MHTFTTFTQKGKIPQKTLQPIIKRPPRITSHQQLKHCIGVLIGNEIGNNHEDILPKRFFFKL